MSNPLVDRILNNPLTFISAKNPEKEVQTIKAAGYIVLNSSAAPASASGRHLISKKTQKREEKKPKSMAEAIAAYTGRKYFGNAVKPKKPRVAKVQKRAAESSEDDAEFESASEYHSDSTFQGTLDLSEDEENTPLSTASDEDMGEVFTGELSTTSELDTNSKSTSEEPHPILNGKVHENISLESITEMESAESSEEDNEYTAKESEIDSKSDASDNESDRNSDSSSESKRNHDIESNTKSEADSESDAENGHIVTHQAYQTTNDEDEEDLGQTNADRLQLKKDLLQDMEKPLSDEAEDPRPQDDNGSLHKKRQLESVMSTHYTLGENKESPYSGRLLRDWTPQFRTIKPAGLLNSGVTCYMNSAIQIMVHIPAVQQYLIEVMQGKHSSIQPRSVTHTFADLALRMWGLGTKKGAAKKFVNPRKLVSRLDDINCMMSEWQQEDSHEYFMSLMSRLQEDSTPKGMKLNESILYDIFGGLLDQEVVCQQCSTSSVTKQEFYDLSLGLTRKRTKSAENDGAKLGNKFTIEKSLRDFFSTETIRPDTSDSSSGYFCEKCQKRTVATKKSAIERSPHVLMVHLKRFKFNGNASSKVKQPIHYSKFLDLGPYSESQVPQKYQLMGVIVHEGRSISSGHYVAQCYQPDGTWSNYDDEYINKIDEATALSDPSAYCLVYQKLQEKPGHASGENGKKRTKGKAPNGKAKRAKIA